MWACGSAAQVMGCLGLPPSAKLAFLRHAQQASRGAGGAPLHEQLEVLYVFLQVRRASLLCASLRCAVLCCLQPAQTGSLFCCAPAWV